MPARLVDGEAIWMSKKLRRVSECWRSHYPLWLPLAEANGTFELDVDQIWSRIYSVILPSVTREDVAKIVAEFINADLLLVWNVDNHDYGFFIGMEKKGRLPSPSKQKDYTKKHPDPPATRSESAADTLGTRIQGLGLGLGLGEEEEKEMALSDKIKEIFFDKTGKIINLPEWALKRFRSGMGGEKEQLARLRDWLDANTDKTFYQYLEVDDEIAEKESPSVTAKGLVKDNRVKELGKKIFEITDTLMTEKHLNNAANLLKEYGLEEILNVFLYSYGKCPDDFYRKQYLNSFFSGGGEIAILSIRDQKSKQEQIMRLAEAPTAPLVCASEAQDEQEGVDLGFGVPES